MNKNYEELLFSLGTFLLNWCCWIISWLGWWLVFIWTISSDRLISLDLIILFSHQGLISVKLASDRIVPVSVHALFLGFRGKASVYLILHQQSLAPLKVANTDER